MNTYYLEQHAQMRQTALLAEANEERLARLIRSDRPGLGQRLRWRVGDWFIALGFKLKAQPQLALWEPTDTHITRLSG